VIDDLLDAWQAEYLPEAKGLRLVGDQWSPRSHAIKDFLAGNLIPYRWLDVTRDSDARALLDAAGVGADELPALFFEDGGGVLRNPEPRQVAERLGRSLSAAYDVYDLVIVGAGPAGLAAAVYGASEGLRTLLLDRHAPGGQAGTSSRIENYLGFPTGVSGSELTRRAITQAQRLGAEFLSPLEVTGVSIDAGYKRLKLADGRELVTRALLAATGMSYHEHPAPGVSEHTGAGVYYGAAITEAAVFGGRCVLVVGGGNSAGQGALYLARHAKEVQVVVRRDTLRATMSQYLIDQITRTPNIRLRPRTEIEQVEGEGRVERVTLVSLDDGSRYVEEADAMFVFIGTRPRSGWLAPSVLCDSKGFVLTGRELMAVDAYARIWKEQREPLPLETSVPGVFAAGDLRAGAMNRVASAVGEGSMVVRLTHEYLALT
jgi:thioredoxin reductase (NADPH)